MKRLDFLINDIKSMSNIGSGSYSKDLLALYFNEAQSKIRNVIFLSNNESNILKDKEIFEVNTGTREFDLPERMYAENSILTVKSMNDWNDSERFTPLRFINYKDYLNEYGYTLFNKKLLLSVLNEASNIERLEVAYNRQLPYLGFRNGSVSSVNGNAVKLTTDSDDDFLSKTDFLTFVDQDGNQLAKDVRIVSQVGTTVTVDNVDGIEIGSYAVIGPYSTTNSVLPIECEMFLRKYVERRVAIGDSAQTDMTSTSLLTEEEKSEIEQLFQKSSDDTIYPVLSPDTVWL